MASLASETANLLVPDMYDYCESAYSSTETDSHDRSTDRSSIISNESDASSQYAKEIVLINDLLTTVDINNVSILPNHVKNVQHVVRHNFNTLKFPDVTEDHMKAINKQIDYEPDDPNKENECVKVLDMNGQMCFHVSVYSLMPYQCLLCQMVYDSRRKLLDHLCNCHKVIVNQCLNCAYNTRLRLQHMRFKVLQNQS